MITVRRERQEDIPAIRAVNEGAFERPDEAGIVDRLREGCEGLLSLVAVHEDRVVGHILFSPVVIEVTGSAGATGGAITGMGLGPMAVMAESQRQGVGSALVRAGLEILRGESCPFVIVLGHPDYYPRFGFEPASRYGLRPQWDGVPDEAFMVIVFDRARMEGASGVAKYRDEFDEVT